MDTPFSRLPAARRAAITRAALEVFGSSDYKRASTDEIAARAGISKGLLFYYFRNKRSLYLYLLRYMYHLIEQHMRSNKVEQIHDFSRHLVKSVFRIKDASCHAHLTFRRQ